MKTEIFTTGFPRSGSTWTVRLLCGLFSAAQQDIPGMEPLVHFGQIVDDNYVVRKTHWYRHQVVEGGYLDGPTYMVWVKRDPRDMVVSMMYYRGLRGQIAETIESIVGEEPFGFGRYVQGWQDEPADFEIRYEDLHERPALVLSGIYSGITGKTPGEDHLRGVIKRNQFARYSTKYPHAMRKGIVGDWKNHFARSDAELMEELHGQQLRDLGYELDGSWVWEVD